VSPAAATGQALPGYAELLAQSNFSFQHGASHPEELVVRARALGYQALALTDECSVAGVVRAHAQAKQSGLRLLPGAVFRLQPSPALLPAAVGGERGVAVGEAMVQESNTHTNAPDAADGWRMVVLPRHLSGWGRLCQYITTARGAARKGSYVATLPAPGSHALAGCEIILLPPRLPVSGGGVDESFSIAVSACIQSVKAIFDHKNHGLWLGVVLHQVADDDWWLMQLHHWSACTGVPLVAAGGVLMHARSRKPLHDVLTAVRLGVAVADCGQALLPNAQAHLRTRLQLARLYPPELMAATVELASRCTFSLDELRYHYPRETVGPGETPSQTLARLVWAGAAWRYGPGEAVSRSAVDSNQISSFVALDSGEVSLRAAPGARGVASHAARARGEPPSAHCEQRLSGGPPLARADLAGAASENHNQNHSQIAPWAGEPASGAGAPNRSAAGRSGVGGDDFCSQHEEPPTPDRYATTPASPSEASEPHLSKWHATTNASPIPPQVKAQIEHELALIAELGYEMYFLTVHDLVRFARSRDILCQGRGSAANSAVCYCLGVTEVDPSQSTLLFERFISRERREPPDIDVDFEHQRREEVIQYIYAKYGRDRAALAATVISYRPRSALRDVGRALGIHPQLIRILAKEHPGMYSRTLLPERLADALQRLHHEAPGAPVPSAHTLTLWLELSQRLMGFPRHLSQHVGGFVLTDGPLTALVPVEPAAMDGRSIIQWDKDDLDAVGLLKVDVLALGMLSALRRALDLLAAKGAVGSLACTADQPLCAAVGGKPAPGQLDLRHPHALSASGRLLMAAIPKDDAVVYQMVSNADTVGVFQVESRAQMSMLPRLRPEVFYDLVVQVAIVRPGPIQGGMVHPYLRRRRGLEPVTYVTPQLKQALGRTLGVPIFQEQVMQVAMLCAGFSAGEADSLRRAMAAWQRKGGVDKFRDRVVSGMLTNGYPQDFAEAIFAQIEGFGEYGFPESHAASFALLAYVSAWVKCHHPDVFLAALLNSQPMGFYSPSQLVQDARRHGVEVCPVDVLVSEWDCTLEMNAGVMLPVRCALAGESAFGAGVPTRSAAGRSGVGGDDFCSQHEEHPTPDRHATHQPVRLGLRLVSGLGESAGRRIVAARLQLHSQGQVFANVAQLAHLAQLNQAELDALAAADALRSLAGHRHTQVWAAAGAVPLQGLFRPVGATDDPLQPDLLPPPTPAQDVVGDYAATGLSLRAHPVQFLRPQLVAQRLSTAAELASYPSGRLARACGIVTVRQQPGTASGVVFVTLEDETGTVNVIVWRALRERQRHELTRSRLLAVYGVWQRDDDTGGQVRHLVARRLKDLTPLLGQLHTSSRDFH